MENTQSLFRVPSPCSNSMSESTKYRRHRKTKGQYQYGKSHTIYKGATNKSLIFMATLTQFLFHCSERKHPFTTLPLRPIFCLFHLGAISFSRGSESQKAPKSSSFYIQSTVWAYTVSLLLPKFSCSNVRSTRMKKSTCCPLCTSLSKNLSSCETGEGNLPLSISWVNWPLPTRRCCKRQ